jgi:hypothetical protein
LLRLRGRNHGRNRGQRPGRRIGEANQRCSQAGVGKAVGDSKLEPEGKADKIEGKVQNAIGDLKDALKAK